MTLTRVFIAAALAISAGACAQLAVAQHGHLEGGSLSLRGTTTVPFVLSGNHMFIKAFVNGTPYAFMFDTGGAAILDPRVQRVLNLPVIGQVHVVGVGGNAQDVDLVRVSEARIGSATYTNGPFIIVSAPVRSSPFPGLRFGGVLGREFFKRLVTTIDYQKSTLTFSEAASFRPDAAAIALPLSLPNDVPTVQASIDGRAGAFRIDSGNGSGVTVTKSFAQLSGLLNASSRAIDVVIGRGVGGIATGTALRAKSLALGGLQLKNPVVMISDSTTGVYANTDISGNIGGEILRRFTMTLDVPHSMLYLRANTQFGEPINFNRIGLFSAGENGAEKVLLVVPGSPAADAGIRVGDTVVRTNDVPAAQLSDYQIAEIWQRPAGSKLRLELQRAGKAFSTTLTLRELL